MGDNWSKTELWQEKLIPLLDWVLSDAYTNSDSLSKPYNELIDKYQNTWNMSTDSIKAYVDENGYDYILNFFNPDANSLKKLVLLLVLIHQMKGSRSGLELILNVLGVTGTVTEWWETTPVGIENTFSLDVDAESLPAGDDPNTYNKFATFIQNYVYPDVKYTINYYSTFGLLITSDVQGQMDFEFVGSVSA